MEHKCCKAAKPIQFKKSWAEEKRLSLEVNCDYGSLWSQNEDILSAKCTVIIIHTMNLVSVFKHGANLHVLLS